MAESNTDQVIEHPAFGRLVVTDDSDPSLLTVQNKHGNTFKMGRIAAGWEVPEYILGLPPPAAVPSPPPRQPAPRAARSVAAPVKPPRVPPPRVATLSNGTNQTTRRQPMDPKIIEFVIERETKNTVRYEEQTNGQPPSVGTLYVQKWALGNPVPQKLKVTVEDGA